MAGHHASRKDKAIELAAANARITELDADNLRLTSWVGNLKETVARRGELLRKCIDRTLPFEGRGPLFHAIAAELKESP